MRTGEIKRTWNIALFLTKIAEQDIFDEWIKKFWDCFIQSVQKISIRQFKTYTFFPSKLGYSLLNLANKIPRFRDFEGVKLRTTISDIISGQGRISSIDSLRFSSPSPPVSMLMKKQNKHNIFCHWNIDMGGVGKLHFWPFIFVRDCRNKAYFLNGNLLLNWCIEEIKTWLHVNLCIHQ